MSTFILASIIALGTILIKEKEVPISLSIGDYIEMGTYLNEPILWRVIHIDEEGDPLLLSHYLISHKSYDSIGDAHRHKIDEVHINPGDIDRVNRGSNLWEDSNIRQWLNASSENIDWKRNPPSKGAKNADLLPYDKESGFLHSNNFSEAEIKTIKQTEYKVILNENDMSKSDGGKELYVPGEMLDDPYYNYEDAFYQTLEDKIFLLSVNEVKEYIYDRGWDITAMYTKKAYNEQAYPDGGFYKYGTSPDFYLLRTPDSRKDRASFVTTVTLFKPEHNLWDLESTVASASYGIRPALYLDLSILNQSIGKGTISEPFRLKP